MFPFDGSSFKVIAFVPQASGPQRFKCNQWIEEGVVDG